MKYCFAILIDHQATTKTLKFNKLYVIKDGKTVITGGIEFSPPSPSKGDRIKVPYSAFRIKIGRVRCTWICQMSSIDCISLCSTLHLEVMRICCVVNPSPHQMLLSTIPCQCDDRCFAELAVKSARISKCKSMFVSVTNISRCRAMTRTLSDDWIQRSWNYRTPKQHASGS